MVSVSLKRKVVDGLTPYHSRASRHVRGGEYIQPPLADGLGMLEFGGGVGAWDLWSGQETRWIRCEKVAAACR